jgi:CRP/FNR family cyclic AMP-dependent transcriptional regulator
VLDVSIGPVGGGAVPLQLGHDPEHGNAMVHLRALGPTARPLQVSISYLIMRSDRAPSEPGQPPHESVSRGRGCSRGGDPADLWPGPPLLARELEVDGRCGDLDRLRRIAATATAGCRDPLGRARRLHAAAGPALRGPGGAERFVALCRLADTPTRLVAGLRVRAGGSVDEHLWAELFVPGRGWIAADPACAVERADQELFALGLDHLGRARGEQVLLQPVQRGPRLPTLSGPYAEVDGRPHPVRTLRRARMEAPGGTVPAGARVPDLPTLLAQELELRFPAPARLRLPRGAVLPSAANGAWLFVISSGCVRLSRLAQAGRSLELGRFAAPALLQADRARRGVIEAIRDSEVRCLTRAQVLQVARRRPEFGLRLLETLGQRLAESEERLEYLAYHTVTARLALVLLHGRDPDGVVDGLTHQQLGDVVGASRETVTKVLHQLQAEGAVHVLPRRIEVLDPDRLAGHLED